MNYFDFQNTDKDSRFIDKAVEIKKEPIIELEEEKTENNLKVKALYNLKAELSAFDTISRRLYGFQSIFKNKNVTSSDEEVITGRASHYAPPSEYSFDVKQKASVEKLISEDFKKDILLPASTIKIKIGEEEEVSFFGGGDIKDFISEVKTSQPNLTPILVNKSTTTSILILSSKKTGTNHTVELLQDSGKVLVKLGFFQEDKLPPLPNRKRNSKQYKSFWNDGKLTIPPQSEVDLILYNNRSRKIDSERYIAFKFLKKKVTNQIVTASTNLPVSPSASNTPINDTSNSSSPSSVETGTISGTDLITNTTTVKVITNERLLQKNLVAALYLNDNQGNQRVVKITSKETKKNKRIFSWKIEEDLAADNNISYQIEKIYLVNPSKNHEYTFHLPENFFLDPKFKEPKVLEKAQNLVFNYEGIDIEREENTVTNFIDGVELLFKKKSSEKVTINVASSSESSASLIIDFINQYNKCLHLLNVYLFSQSTDDIEVDEEEKKYYSVFRSDTSIYNLRSNLRNIMTFPYETSKGKLLLSSVGTKSVFFREENVDNNKIQIQEEKYLQTFDDTSRLQSLSELFSYDKDQDGKIDSGISHEVRKFLKPYLSYSDNSFFKSKVNLIKEVNKGIGERVAKLEEDAEEYREELEEDMIKIKQAEEEQKRSQQFFDAQK